MSSRRSSSQSLIAAVFLIAALVIALFVWQPFQEEVKTLQADLVTKEATLAQLEGEVARLQSLEANLPVAESERERILGAVPIGLNQDQLVSDLDDIAGDVGVSLNAMSFSLATQGKESVVSMVANFHGEYADLITLLKALENNDRLFQVNSVSVQFSEDDESDDQLMNFSVTLEAYYQS